MVSACKNDSNGHPHGRQDNEANVPLASHSI